MTNPEMEALRKERRRSTVKIIWSFIAGGITAVLVIGLAVSRAPDPMAPPKSEIKMLETKTFAGKQEVNAIVFCIGGKKMVAIYTKSELQEIGKCDEKDCHEKTAQPGSHPIGRESKGAMR
jgi:hypothetical protein